MGQPFSHRELHRNKCYKIVTMAPNSVCNLIFLLWFHRVLTPVDRQSTQSTQRTIDGQPVDRRASTRWRMHDFVYGARVLSASVTQSISVIDQWFTVIWSFYVTPNHRLQRWMDFDLILMDFIDVDLLPITSNCMSNVQSRSVDNVE